MTHFYRRQPPRGAKVAGGSPLGRGISAHFLFNGNFTSSVRGKSGSPVVTAGPTIVSGPNGQYALGNGGGKVVTNLTAPMLGMAGAAPRTIISEFYMSDTAVGRLLYSFGDQSAQNRTQFSLVTNFDYRTVRLNLYGNDVNFAAHNVGGTGARVFLAITYDGNLTIQFRSWSKLDTTGQVIFTTQTTTLPGPLATGTTFPLNLMGGGTYAFTSMTTALYYQSMYGGRCLTPAEIDRLYADRHQVIEPAPAFPYAALSTVSAGTGATASPTGVSASATVGTAAASGSAGAAPAGVSASGLVGSVAASGGTSATASPPGVAASGLIGTAAASGTASAAPSGVSASAMVGTATASAGSSATAAPAGVSASGLIGIASASGASSAVPSGVVATVATGTASASGAASASPPGVSASAAVGTATASSTGGGTAAPAGVSAAVSVGTPAASGGASVQVSGVSASGQVGAPTASAGTNGTAAPAGVGAVASVGSLAASGGAGCAPAGVVAYASIGAVIAAGTIVIHGVASPAGVVAYARVGIAGARTDALIPLHPAYILRVSGENRILRVSGENRILKASL